MNIYIIPALLFIIGMCMAAVMWLSRGELSAQEFKKQWMDAE